MEFISYNPDQAFIEMIHVLQGIRGEHKIRRQDSRNGKVIRVIEPVTIQHRSPLNRVLFNQERDCNPFFHLFEAMWMLAGRNDLAPLQYFVSTFGQFSDDGKTLNGAYGYRWRHAPEMFTGFDTEQTYERNSYDQLNVIIEELRNNPDSRRCVLQMWNVQDDLMK